MNARPPLRLVSAAELRHLFNHGRYWERAKSGELQERALRSGHPSPPRAPEPLCTRSMIIAYIDTRGVKVAIVHQYLRPDGTIGASGRPDPKRLLMNGILYGV
ncbi:MAG: hypothetical protein ACR2PL_23570 [Dehalococcoidia bacterium]